MKKLFFALTILCSLYALAAQDLAIGPDDIAITQSPKGGYNLYIRKKPGIGSVLLTETTRDPELKADNYAYRALEYNPVNGDEKRMLDGEFISPEKKLWSLIDSTPVVESPVGEAFHIWIPYVIAYGYEWSRNGEVQVLDGTYLNIRAFEKPYGDYSGTFADNPYRLRLTQKPVPAPPPDDTVYMDDTVKSFTSLADGSSGAVKYARGPEDIVPLVREIRPRIVRSIWFLLSMLLKVWSTILLKCGKWSYRFLRNCFPNGLPGGWHLFCTRITTRIFLRGLPLRLRPIWCFSGRH